MTPIDGAILALWWVAAAGLVLGGIGTALGVRARRRGRGLEAQLGRAEDAIQGLRERDTRRARLYATIEQEVTVRAWLTIRNEGHATARDFTISINGAALDRCPLIDAQALDPEQLAAVAAHGTLRIPLTPGPCGPNSLQLELTWTDASGELGFYEADLPR